MSRHAGLIVPLFSVPSSQSWGIGEIPDLIHLADWMASAALERVMLLPLGTVIGQETSPYAAASTFAIDPAFIALPQVEDFERAGGVGALSSAGLAHLAAAREPGPIRYAHVRAAKREALDKAFRRFLEDEWSSLTPRAAACAAFMARERDWLDDYALFHALTDVWPGREWPEWPEPIRARDPRAMAEARRELARDVLRHQYEQWVAHEQWQDARRAARVRGVSLVGDLPFVAARHSADVWSRQSEFALEISTGVPPDAFSDTGQDWGLPFYRWPAIAAANFASYRQRLRRMAALFDALRVDHLVGLFRTYGRPLGGDPFFSPPVEHEQLAQGETILRLLVESGLHIIAEDLGTVPDFVRDALARAGVPGCKVLRWERHWQIPGQPFVDPAMFPARSAAMTGTHDTEPLAVWWARASADERAAARQLPIVGACLDGGDQPDPAWTDALRDAWLALAYSSGSNDLFVVMQDLFGWTDRINTPATVGDHNWTWRLPVPVEALSQHAWPRERAAFCALLARETGRALVATIPGRTAGTTLE